MYMYSLHDVRLVFEHGRFVTIHVEVVGSAKDGHDGGESGRLGLAVHSVSTRSIVRQWELGRQPVAAQRLTLHPEPRGL